MKCAIRQELIIRQPQPSTQMEDDLGEHNETDVMEVQQERNDEPVNFVVDIDSDAEE